MNNEFYIVQAIKWNSSVRNLIYELVTFNANINNPDGILEELNDLQDLQSVAVQLNCDLQDVFTRLKAAIGTEFGLVDSSRGMKKTSKNISMFFNDTFLRGVSNIIGCSPLLKDVIQKLFDPDRLLRVAKNIGISTENVEIDRVFWKMVSNTSREEINNKLGISDIWSFLSMLLREEVGKKLCTHYECSEQEIFDKLSQAVDCSFPIENAASIDKEGVRSIDSLAVAKVREWLLAIAHTYLHRATSFARDVWNDDKNASGSCMILPIMEFNLLREYISAIKHIMELKAPVRNLFPRYEIKQQIRNRPGLALSITIVHNEDNRKFVVIKVQVDLQEGFEEILVIQANSDDELNYLNNNLPRKTDSLSPEEETIADGILSYMLFPPENGIRSIISAFLDNKNHEILQASVFWGIDLPNPFCIEYCKSNDELPVLDRNSISICESPDHLFELIKESYVSEGIDVKVV
ncbi:MAG: hypothetical protein JW915_03300 [Chitinispirillaceae bacterium]|nr:hypothetical protein [Chitinispirillaceae bacterium]